MGWNCLSIPKLQGCNRWSLGMDKCVHPSLYWAYDYLSTLELKLIHASKRDPNYFFINKENTKALYHWLFVKGIHRIMWKMWSQEFSMSYIIHISHDDVIKWKHFPRYWPFVRGIHRSPVNSPHKGQGRGALMFSLICAWIKGWTMARLVIWDAISPIMTSSYCAILGRKSHSHDNCCLLPTRNINECLIPWYCLATAGSSGSRWFK